MKNKLLTTISLILFCMNVSAADVPILLYHNIGETYTSSQADMHITPAMFEEHIKTLAESGYNSVRITDAVNGAPMPENPAARVSVGAYSRCAAAKRLHCAQFRPKAAWQGLTAF